MSRQDKLWKAIIEELFVDLLARFYPDFIQEIDFSKPVEFLDKDLPKLFPEAAALDRKADKVAKIPLLDGTKQWLIVHIEVQGYKDPDFAHRMFTYYYRLAERFGKKVAAMVIYSDNNKENRVSRYEVSCLNTRLIYEFDTFIIADHSAEEYEKMDNPLGLIFLTALLGIQRKQKDEALLQMKTQLFRKLLEKGYDAERIRAIATFIKEYVGFSKKEYYRKFDERTDELTKTPTNMGIIETVIQYRTEEAVAEATAKGLEQGLEKGLEQGIEKGLEQGIEIGKQQQAYLTEFEKNTVLILRSIKLGLPTKEVATLLAVDELFISEFKEKVDTIVEKILQEEIKRIKSKFSPNYSLKLLQADIIKLLLALQFSEKAVSKALKCPLKLVQLVKKKTT